jgi:hypothetical protein
LGVREDNLSAMGGFESIQDSHGFFGVHRVETDDEDVAGSELSLGNLGEGLRRKSWRDEHHCHCKRRENPLANPRSCARPGVCKSNHSQQQHNVQRPRKTA